MRARILISSVALLMCGVVGVRAQEPPPHKPGGDVKPPVLVKEFKPKYTPATMRAGVQGNVVLDVVVKADGSVGDVKVTKPLHPELDEQAISTVRKWQFKAGTKGGEPVPVLVEIEMTFTLRKGPPRAPLD
jgi:periplasmic protein TonB